MKNLREHLTMMNSLKGKEKNWSGNIWICIKNRWTNEMLCSILRVSMMKKYLL